MPFGLKRNAPITSGVRPVRVENGALTIQNGFTHYPQQREIIRYFRGDVSLPERIILLDGSGSISFDVLSWLAEQKVSFIRIDYHLAGNRNAAHPVNAILNYAYAALESEIRIKAVSNGYDPTIGIMHEGSDGSSKFIFDFMEPERPRVDRAVLEFVKAHVFNPSDFVIRTDGVCRLNPEMARMLVAKVSR
jgi:CRISPR/Cas system-associated endonuclease Cas1